jgi:Flp pilus assembly protein TadG
MTVLVGMTRRLWEDRGSVTAEFAAVLPAVVLVLGCALGAMQLASEQLRLQGADAQAARMLGRGDPGARALILAVNPGATFVVRTSGDLVCADARAPASIGILLGVTISASACALDDAQE